MTIRKSIHVKRPVERTFRLFNEEIDTLTIADFAVGAPMVLAEAARYPTGKYAEITRWYGGLASLPAWKKAIVPLPG